MNRPEIERELREKLASVSGRSELTGRVLPFGYKVATALLPWVMEMREEAARQERIDDGQLPHG